MGRPIYRGLTRLLEKLSGLHNYSSRRWRFARMETYTNGFRREITEFISVSERIQSLVARGEPLSRDEAGVVWLCATELLEKVPEPR